MAIIDWDGNLMYKNLVFGHGPILGIVSFLESQLQHFHWWFVLQPGKKSKEKDVEKMFKLNQGQCGHRPRVFPLLLLEWKSCLRSWQRGESRDGCDVVMQRHLERCQSSAWKFLIWSGNSPLCFSEVHKHIHAWRHTRKSHCWWQY